MKEDKFKKEYDAKGLGEIEEEIMSTRGSVHLGRIKIIRLLNYLYCYNRFREDARYKESTFETYLLDKFSMRLPAFRNDRTILLKYPEESKKHGIGMVAQIVHKCKAPQKILETISKAQAIRMRPLTRGHIEKIINENRRPTIPPEPKVPAISHSDMDIARKRIRDLEEINRKNKEQIERLIKTIKELKPYKEKYEQIRELFRPVLGQEEKSIRV